MIETTLTFHLVSDDAAALKDFNAHIGSMCYFVELATGMHVFYAEWGDKEDEDGPD